MESTLEKELGKPDWKQWLPGFGIYKIYNDICKGEPSLFDTPGLIRNLAFDYHLITLTASMYNICYPFINNTPSSMPLLDPMTFF